MSKPKSPNYISRILREAGVTKSKRKPHGSSEAAILREKLEDAQDELRVLRREKSLLERELAFERQRQVDQVRRRLNGVMA